MSLRLLYLIFVRVCGGPVLLGRSSASKNAELLGPHSAAILTLVDPFERRRSMDGRLVTRREALAQAVTERALELVVSALDMNALLDRGDLNAVLDQVDIDPVLDRIDLDRLLASMDFNASSSASTSTH